MVVVRPYGTCPQVLLDARRTPRTRTHTRSHAPQPFVAIHQSGAPVRVVDGNASSAIDGPMDGEDDVVAVGCEQHQEEHDPRTRLRGERFHHGSE